MSIVGIVGIVVVYRFSFLVVHRPRFALEFSENSVVVSSSFF